MYTISSLYFYLKPQSISKEGVMNKKKLIEVPIKIKPIQSLDLPLLAKPLSVEVLGDKIFVFFLVSSYANETVQKRNIKIYKSGKFVADKEEFVGTFRISDSMIFHVFLD